MIKLFKQVAFILTKKDKIKLFIIFLIIIGSAILDLIGVSAIFPIISLLTNGEEAIDNNSVLNLFSAAFKTRNVQILSIILLIALCVFYFLKTIYMLACTYATSKFTLSNSRRLTKRLMEAYLSFPYEFHLNNNSSTLIRKSNYDVNNFTSSLNALLSFSSKLLTTLAIVIYLIVTDYRIALIVGGVLFLFSLFVVLVLKPFIKKIAKKSQKLNSNNYKLLSQSFNGIKESKISNTEDYFVGVYDENRGNINNLTLKMSILNAIPVNCLELFGMIGICLSLAVIILVGNDATSQIINIFAVFVYAVIKLLPAVSTVTNTINNINYYKISVDSLFEDLKLSEDPHYVERLEKDVESLPFNNSIEIKNLSFFYELAPEKIILNDISFRIEKNTSVAFSGTSGAGKTTLVDVILGLLPTRKGQILVDGTDISENIRGWRANISYIPQNIYLSDDSIRNNIAFGIDASKINDEKIWDSLYKAQLKEFVEGLPNGLDTVVGERGIRMSGGQRQRIGIARAFYRNTNIIVFDEATSALDFETEKSILDHVSRVAADHTLIIITHRLDTIKNCDNVYKIEDGKIAKIK